jgi:hypothetical protein
VANNFDEKPQNKEAENKSTNEDAYPICPQQEHE